MKNYASRAHKGRAAYRTPSRWLAGQPERYKKLPGTKLKHFPKGGSMNFLRAS